MVFGAPSHTAKNFLSQRAMISRKGWNSVMPTKAHQLLIFGSYISATSNADPGVLSTSSRDFRPPGDEHSK
jgi:hypothetical protein